MKNISKNEKLLIAINGSYTLANAMSAVFMNVYLYAYTGSLVVMTIYTIIRIGLYPFFFTLGGKWAQRAKFSWPLSAGLLLIMGSLIFLLFASDLIGQMQWLVYVIALIVGVGEGLYWLSINSLNQLVSSRESRAGFIGGLGIINNFSNLVAPLISTFIISMAGSDIAGYVDIFKIVLVIYAFISVLSSKVTVKAKEQAFSVLYRMRSHGDPQWRYVIISTFLYGIRDSLILTLAGLLVYNATGGSGSSYGKLLSVFAVLAITAYYLSGKIILRRNRMKCYQFGAVLIASSTIVLVLFPNLWGAIYYGVVNAIATPFYSNPWTLIMMNAMQDYAENENVVGCVIAKESYMSIGRITGMLVIVALYFLLPDPLYLTVSVIICSSFPIVLVIYATMYHKKRDALKKQGLVQ